MLKHSLHETNTKMKHKRYKNFKTFFLNIILIDFLGLLYDFIVNLDAGLVTDFRLAPCVIFILYNIIKKQMKNTKVTIKCKS